MAGTSQPLTRAELSDNHEKAMKVLAMSYKLGVPVFVLQGSDIHAVKVLRVLRLLREPRNVTKVVSLALDLFVRFHNTEPEKVEFLNESLSRPHTNSDARPAV